MNFDLATTELKKGVQCLEASAGTGKTYTLAGLFLRLMLEEKVPAQKILVVTFTNAATAELRDRIRSRLRQALSALEGQETEDELLRKLTNGIGPQRGTAIASLRSALELFDLVSIFTIHGFCQRTLQENAFESGILFDTELIPDQKDLIRQAAADFCRNNLHTSDKLMASLGLHLQLNPDAFSRILEQYLTHPDLELAMPAETRPADEAGRDVRDHIDPLGKEWKAFVGGGVALVDFFVGGEKWAIGDHAKRDVVEAHAGWLGRGLDEKEFSIEFWKAVEFFSMSNVVEEIGSDKQMPEPCPPIFERCEHLRCRIDEYRTAERAAFLRGAVQALARAKQDAKQQSYDDLIRRLADALDGDSGQALARSIRARYHAALIDESQDTDPLQWKIFRTVFGSGTDHWLYLIGDPKQAIYAFRGADVDAYLEAAQEARDRYTLGTNWRSESALVRGVNALFSSASVPFINDKIGFQPVDPGPKADIAPMGFPDGRPRAPFQVWCWEGANGTVTLADAQGQVPASVAAEVARLLSGPARLGDRALQPHDIAVLVESHRQAGWIQSALRDLGIPSVEQAVESVFDSDQAREILWILSAILTSSRESAVKAAITTDMLGLNGTELHSLVSDESQWQKRLHFFARYREAWENDGFLSMFMELLRQERVINNLLQHPDAERRITNLLHIAELLQSACQTEHLGPARLVQWLQERCIDNASDAEEYQLRLESDEDAVQIVTIHRAKGLEYPVVFCPFVAKDAKAKQITVGGRDVMDVVLYHDPKSGKLSWDIGAPIDPDRSRRAARERLAEQVRLLYVALTRARNRCYLVSARYRNKPSTALAWLLRRFEDVPDDLAGALKNDVQAGAWTDRWRQIAAKSERNGNSGIAVGNLPTDPGKRWNPEGPGSGQMEARSCSREMIGLSWSLSSFSQLARQAPEGLSVESDEGLPDHDESTAADPLEAAAAIEPEETAKGIFALPAGARTGDCLHRILERFDFQRPVDDAVRLDVRQQLEASHLWNESHADAIADMLERVRAASLDPGDSNLTLARVPPSQRRTEMEFQFPAAQLDARQLLRLIRDQDRAAAPLGPPAAALPAGSLHMFLKGYIDLIFMFNGRYHIVDWKSNLLGYRTSDYTREAMKAAVENSFYDLQYHIYTVALDKFLRRRLPGYDYEQHFGGVHYVFVRGLEPLRADLGLFHDRPPRERIERLSSVLGPAEEERP